MYSTIVTGACISERLINSSQTLEVLPYSFRVIYDMALFKGMRWYTPLMSLLN